MASVLAVFGLNGIRLVNLILIARFYPEQLELFHLYIWQTLIIVIAFALFLFWSRFAAGVQSGRLENQAS